MPQERLAFLRRESGAPTELIARAQRVLGSRVVDARRQDGGYTPAERWALTFEDRSSVFAKMGTTPLTAGWLVAEHGFYEHAESLGGFEFAPRLLGWDPHRERPLVLLEDLSAGDWPPPWTAERIERVCVMLERVAATNAPDWAPSIEERRAHLAGWTRVQSDPAPFLRLGLATAAWLQVALARLVDAEASAVLDGDALVHLDVRSDNLCFVGRRTVLVDWNNTARGNALLDLAAWLPSLQSEGGPPPWELMPDSGGFSALLSGYFAANAGLPYPEGAPRVRGVQLAQLRTSLPWAIRELGLPPLDGHSAR
ncbi:MAG: aminoglycoside phosphotransferase family protein [Dehalococcoidia bacterium]|nr:aminoglycoside phosphotransferase family protein [Dehalococcoidia bacterium]